MSLLFAFGISRFSHYMAHMGKLSSMFVFFKSVCVRITALNTLKEAGPDMPSDWYSGGCGFNPWLSHISFVEIWSEMISMAILSLL